MQLLNTTMDAIEETDKGYCIMPTKTASDQMLLQILAHQVADVKWVVDVVAIILIVLL